MPVLLAIGLAASGVVGILGFWAYYGDRLLGESFSYLVLFGSIVLVCLSLYGGHLNRALLRSLAVPLALWALGSAFVLFLGFAHGGAETPLATAATRFSHPLPPDNEIPRFFADWFFANGHDGVPAIFPGEWHSSDRPPLQVGYALSQRPFGWDGDGLSYQVLGVVLQQLWIVGLWALLLAARIGRVTRGLVMATALVSALTIVNAFFVWPKLLPAAMLLAVAALVTTPLWSEVRRSLWAAALIAGLCGLAMLGHGSSVFGIVPLALLAAYRGLPSLRWLGVGLAVGAVLMGSWAAFQKYDDPPGNRLTKWTLASALAIDDRSTSEAVVDAYDEAGVGGTIDNKVENFETMVGGVAAWDTLENAVRSGDIGEIARAFRSVFFFYLLPSLGLLLLAPVAMAIARVRGPRHGAEWSFALTCFAVFALGSVVWGLLVFGGPEDRTLVHISSYLLPLLGVAGAIAGLRATFPRFALGLAGAAVLLTLALYAPALDPPSDSAYSPLYLLLAAAGLAGFAIVAMREDEADKPQAAVDPSGFRPTDAAAVGAAAGGEPSRSGR
ncbi:MAG TPA: hypothetical protein VIS95_03135 [Solirubrobacterales bacterium]